MTSLLRRTSRIVTSRQKYSSSSLSLSNDMACSRCTQNTILPDEEFLDSIGSTDFGYQLHHLGVVVPSIPANHEKAAICTFGYGEKDASDERLAVMGLLEDRDLLS